MKTEESAGGHQTLFPSRELGRGLGTRLVSAGNSFFDYSEFEAMKSLSGWVAARCDEHQFRAKIKVST